MQNDDVVPVNHGVVSATGAVASGAVGGAMKSAGKSTLYITGALALTGLVIGLTGGFGAAIPLLSGIGSVGSVAAYTIGGGLLGLLGSAVAAPIAAIFGAGKGTVNASERVAREKGASRMLEAQVASMQAQAQAMAASVPVNDNKYNFPAQGSTMNQASPHIMADTAQSMGAVAGQALQRA